MTTLQKTVVTATVAVLAGTGIYQARQASQLREENRTLQQQHAPLVERVESLIGERDQTAQQLSALRDENERLYRNTGELLRLRGEIGVLKRQLAEHQAQAESRRTDNREITGDAGFTLAPGALNDMGNSTPEANPCFHFEMANGILHAMKTEMIQIDKAGRVVLPKPLREQFQLLPGDKLRLSVEGTSIKLEPTEVAGTLVRKGGVLVFRGEFSEALTATRVEEVLQEARAERFPESTPRRRRT
jgi:AbrB family looped-hinge helix DNA binding protein